MKIFIESKSIYINGMYVVSWSPIGHKIDDEIFVNLHGFPAWGSKNYDICELIAGLGYTVLSPHYVGLGHSTGQFGFENSIEEIEGILVFIKDRYPHSKISFLGHSWGGYVSARLSAYVTSKIILLAPLLAIPSNSDLLKLVDENLIPCIEDCPGYERTTLISEFKNLALRLDPISMIDNEVLIFHGKNDTVLPIDPVKKNSKLLNSCEFIELEDDHSFSTKRRKIYSIITERLKR